MIDSPGVLNLRVVDQYGPRPVRNQATRQEVRLNVMHRDHPETIPNPPTPTSHSWSVEYCLPQNQSLVLKSLGTTVIACKTKTSGNGTSNDNFNYQ